jgi:peptidoglycan/xylan/chitin deacetylase (PgdA/CDA1 family)
MQVGDSTLVTQQELVLVLHGVGTPHNGVSGTESFFWLSRWAFSGLLEAIAAKQQIANFGTVITFDDGNMSDVTIALPELVKLGLKAIFFVCAARIGSPKYLDRVALAELIAAGMEIGTHGMNHRDWRQLAGAELDSEVRDARLRIEDACAKPITKAAIPFGSYDRRVLQRLRREPFKCVYTSDRGMAKSQQWLKTRTAADRTWENAEIEQVLFSDASLMTRLYRNTARLYKILR